MRRNRGTGGAELLELVTAVRFSRPTTSGRTKPGHFVCLRDSGEEVEAIVKFSAGCDRGIRALIVETIAACLAVDLELPVPEPLLVRILPELAEAIGSLDIATHARHSSEIAFGSVKLPQGFQAWLWGRVIGQNMRLKAAEIFAFDGLIENFDRRRQNPNCLYLGETLAIIDHEVAFGSDLPIFGRLDPWQTGGLNWMTEPEKHIFYEGLRRKNVDLTDFGARWAAITDERLAQYKAALPLEWATELPFADSAIALIQGIRRNMVLCLAEVARVLR